MDASNQNRGLEKEISHGQSDAVAATAGIDVTIPMPFTNADAAAANARPGVPARPPAVTEPSGRISPRAHRMTASGDVLGAPTRPTAFTQTRVSLRGVPEDPKRPPAYTLIGRTVTKNLVTALTQPGQSNEGRAAGAVPMSFSAVLDAATSGGSLQAMRGAATGMTGFPSPSVVATTGLAPAQFRYRPTAATLTGEELGLQSTPSHMMQNRVTTVPAPVPPQPAPPAAAILPSAASAVEMPAVPVITPPPPVVVDRKQIERPPPITVPLDVHVESRSGRAKRRTLQSRSLAYRLCKFTLDKLVFTLRFVVTMGIIIAGIVFEYAFPNKRVGDNTSTIYEWLYFIGATMAVMYPLQWAEHLLFRLLDYLSHQSEWLLEVGDFANSAKGHLSNIGTVIFALLMQEVFFALILGESVYFYFVRTCAALIFLECGLIIKNVLLKIFVRAVYRFKHHKHIIDVLFYEETARKLSAPEEGGVETTQTENTTASGTEGQADTAQENKLPPEVQPEERSMTPTYFLENESFWSQASYVKTTNFSIYDDELGVVVEVTDQEQLQDLVGAAFDRLYAKRLRKDRVEAQRRLEERNAELYHQQLENRAVKHTRSNGLFNRLKRVATGGHIKDAISGMLSAGRHAADQHASLPWRPTPQPHTGATPTASPSPHPPGSGGHSASTEHTADPEHGTPNGFQSPASPQSPWTPIDPPDLLHPDDEYNADIEALERRVPGLIYEDIAACYDESQDSLAVSKLLDLDGSGEISRDEFSGSFLIMYNAWKNAQTSLQAYGSISGTISLLTSMVYWVVTALVILAIYDVSFVTALVPFTTLVISFSFAFGPTIQRLLDSLLFVTVLAPFDVGDRVNISTIASGSTAYVHRINLLTTEFRDIRGKMYIARNSDLTSQTILNQRRSQEATFDPVVWLDEHLTAHDFKKLEAWIKEFLRRNPLDWKPGLFIAVGVAEPNRVTLTFWVTHRKTWQDASSIWPAYSQFMYEVVAAMRTIGLRYTLPPQSISFKPPPPGYDAEHIQSTTTNDVPEQSTSPSNEVSEPAKPLSYLSKAAINMFQPHHSSASGHRTLRKRTGVQRPDDEESEFAS